MDISFLRSSNKEIGKMNEGKLGAPFEYSHSYIQFLAFLIIGFKIAYRTIQGIVRKRDYYLITSGLKKCSPRVTSTAMSEAKEGLEDAVDKMKFGAKKTGSKM
ncbi:MAG: hypothetical protein JO297_06685, partial [Nitrososphaeraceae archaeon]|nr:hypothetical protein [Nitrososphaeraceae archaeon]